jgi:hypothetical protein
MNQYTSCKKCGGFGYATHPSDGELELNKSFETILNQKFYLTLKLNNNNLTINEPSRLNGMSYYLHSIGRTFNKTCPNKFFKPIN